MNKPLVSPRALVYQNPYQKIFRVEANFGQFSKEYYVLATGEKAGIVVIREDQVLLVRQYRLLIDRMSWEIPGGKVESGEGIEDAARRECLEETGILCGDLVPLLAFHPTLDALHNPTHLYYGKVFDGKIGEADLSNEEVCGKEWIPLKMHFHDYIPNHCGQHVHHCTSVLQLLYSIEMTICPIRHKPQYFLKQAKP